MVRTVTLYVCALFYAVMPAYAAAHVARPGPAAVLTIKVVDNTGAPAYVLQRAADIAQRVFRAAGIKTAWVVCANFDETAEPSQNPACYENPADLYVQSVTSRPNNLVPLWDSFKFGAALFTDDGLPGRHSYVLYDRVEKEAETAPCSRIALLGLIMAHEVGHLLLGKGHANEGVMMPRWNHETEAKIARGVLLFLPEEAKRMQASARVVINDRAVYAFAATRSVVQF